MTEPSRSDQVSPELRQAAVNMVLDDLKHLWLSGKSLFEVLDVIYETMRQLIPFDRLSVAFVNEETGLVVSRWVRSESEVRRVGTGYWAVLKGSSLEPILRTGQPRIINDLEQYLLSHPDSRATRDILQDGILANLTCPLRAAGRPIGFLFFASRRPGVYDAAHIETFAAVAEALTLAVEKVKYIDDLEQAKRNYAQVLYFVAHELKSPLASAVTIGQTLVEGYVGKLTPRQEEKVQRMVANCQYLLNLVRDYLDLAQIEAGEMHYRPRPEVELADEVVLPVLEIQAPSAAARKMTIVKDLEHLVAPGDPDLLRIVVNNLVGNAVKYGREGGVISISLVRRAFFDYDDSGQRQRRYWAQFTIRNDGAGFSPEQKQRLFARFQRLGRAEDKTTTGSGLGLYISRQIVVRHGGEISADSEAGQWAEFRFRLPLNQEPALVDVPA
ncbi:MAG: GAF domain-containing sensor histidine kinase [candidate division WOR-3 bacterium]